MFALFTDVLKTTAEENTSITITCSTGNMGYRGGFWYRGYFTAVTGPAPTIKQTLFTHIPGRLNNVSSRADMSVNSKTFSMTIGRVQLKDDGYFSCRVLHEWDSSLYYDQTRVDVFSK